MGLSICQRVLSLCSLAVAALALAGCGGRSPLVGGDGAAPGIQSAAPPCPPGVDSATWQLLTTELERVRVESGSAGRQVSAVPTGNSGRVEIAYDAEATTLSWLYHNGGDYDQNGIVGVSDLTPLGVHFGEVSPDGAGQPFPEGSLGAAIDGNGDGLIGISDVTPVGQNFGAQVAGYNVYMSTEQDDYPFNPADDNGPGTVLSGVLAFSAALGSTAERKRFEYVLPEDADPGLYWVRPTDGESDGAASNGVAVGVLNLAPIAVVSAEPAAGLAPLTVKFSGTASGDLDGEIDKYEWDWNGLVGGEEWEDTGELGIATHVYEEAGSYLATLRVTDDGGKTDTDIVLIKVRMPIPPQASLTAEPSTGPAPLAVVYDATASVDSDGEVVNYRWDFDGTGNYAYDSGAEPTTTFYYYEPGTYSTMVRVTDDDGLSADSAGLEVTVEPGAEWHDVIVPTIDVPTASTALAEVDGTPAIVHHTFIVDVSDSDLTRYVRADDPEGTTWAAPVVIQEGKFSDFSLAVVDGRPAIAGFNNTNDVAYIRADDSDGTSWPEADYVTVDSFGDGSFALIGGAPALCRGIFYIRAIDPAGAAWGDRVRYASGTTVPTSAYPSMCVVDDRPAISYYVNGHLAYARADDAEGQAWGLSTVIDDQESATGGSQLLVVNGNPAVAYYYPTLGTLKYVRALDAEGSSWGEPQVLALAPEAPYGLILVDNRPAILYKDLSGLFSLHCLIANDPDGASWSFPMLVAGGYGVGISFALVDGGPAVSTTQGGGEDAELHYAAYY